jgi:hypothetical protein
MSSPDAARVTPVGRITIYVDGQPRTLEYPLERLVFTGKYLCDMMVARLSLDVVRSLLASELEYLDPTGAFAAQGVPVIFSFGYMDDVRGALPLLDLNYRESLMAIPNCRLVSAGPYGYGGPFLFPTRLYLDQLTPTIMGLLAGYPKVWVHVKTDQGDVPANGQPPAWIQIGGEMMDLFKFDSPNRLEGRFSAPASADWTPVKQLPGFQELTELLNQPVFGRELLDHRPLYSEIAFDLDSAMGMPLEAEVNFLQPFVAGMPAGTWSWPGSAHDGLEPRVGFRIRMNWQLAGTFDPQGLRIVS